ncbi:hypothetical protein B0H17DRAFT_1133641 [Mycena rosella]|uniref:Uncharacterized protein n=1 Tax=Mycena rosella TaxID=1033263 RepID=A0AAD7DHK8_MYCRO|nr:hypothetical protein B0H17DRAFT_1133641 [Mycena rosella]
MFSRFKKIPEAQIGLRADWERQLRTMNMGGPSGNCDGATAHPGGVQYAKVDESRLDVLLRHLHSRHRPWTNPISATCPAVSADIAGHSTDTRLTPGTHGSAAVRASPREQAPCLCTCNDARLPVYVPRRKGAAAAWVQWAEARQMQSPSVQAISPCTAHDSCVRWARAPPALDFPGARHQTQKWELGVVDQLDASDESLELIVPSNRTVRSARPLMISDVLLRMRTRAFWVARALNDTRTLIEERGRRRVGGRRRRAQQRAGVKMADRHPSVTRPDAPYDVRDADCWPDQRNVVVIFLMSRPPVSWSFSIQSHARPVHDGPVHHTVLANAAETLAGDEGGVVNEGMWGLTKIASAATGLVGSPGPDAHGSALRSTYALTGFSL